MHSDDFSEFHVDLEELERLRSGRPCAIEGFGTVRADRTHSAGRIGDRAAVVALPTTGKWNQLRPNACEIIGVSPVATPSRSNSAVRSAVGSVTACSL
jgi:hypothetical protein